jgi:hypothetical protein
LQDIYTDYIICEKEMRGVRKSAQKKGKQRNVIEGERCREIREIFMGKSENTIEEKQIRGLIKKK